MPGRTVFFECPFATVRPFLGLLLVKIIVQAGVQYPLRKRLLQIIEQTVLDKQLLCLASGKQPVQKFLLNGDAMISFPSS